MGFRMNEVVLAQLCVFDQRLVQGHEPKNALLAQKHSLKWTKTHPEEFSSILSWDGNDLSTDKKNPLRVAEKHVLPKRKTRLLFWAHEKSTFISVFSWQLSSTVINARLFRLNIPSSLRSVNTSCMYPCGITYLSIHSPFPFSYFVLAANRVASVQRFLLLHETWETSLFAELPFIHHLATQDNLFVIPLTSKRSEKDVLQARGFWIVREERRETASRRRGGEKNQVKWAEEQRLSLEKSSQL